MLLHCTARSSGVQHRTLIGMQVVVASKFDNRLKEFAERWEVDRYLSATGYLHPNARPFFVALPKVCSRQSRSLDLS